MNTPNIQAFIAVKGTAEAGIPRVEAVPQVSIFSKVALIPGCLSDTF